MIRSYKHIIWDWNGTIFCDVDLGIEIMNGLLDQRGLPLLTITRNETTKGWGTTLSGPSSICARGMARSNAASAWVESCVIIAVRRLENVHARVFGQHGG